VHDEVLAGEVCEHDDSPANVGFNLVEFQEGEQVVAEGEKQAARCDKAERVRSGHLVAL
jgi:hypothetical protein